MAQIKFTWKYLKSLPEVDDVELHDEEITGNEGNSYLICLNDDVPNPATGEMGNTFYAGDPKDALEQLGYYCPNRKLVSGDTK